MHTTPQPICKGESPLIRLAKATGTLGSHILDALHRSGRYNVTVLVRDENSKMSLPPQVMIVRVDYDSATSLISALQGQEVLVSALGKGALEFQTRLFDAAVEASVRRVIPSEFGSDLMNPKTRLFPTYSPKVLVEEQLMRCCELSDTSYTFIYTNCLFDWGISKRGSLLLDPVKRIVKFYDGGQHRFSTTTMATVGRAVVAVLDQHEHTANRAVYVQDAVLSSHELLELVKEVTAGDGGEEWTTLHVSTEEAEAKAWQSLEEGASAGNPFEIFYGFAVRAAFAPGHGGFFSSCDNELLGIDHMSRDDMKRLIQEMATEDWS